MIGPSIHPRSLVTHVVVVTGLVCCTVALAFAQTGGQGAPSRSIAAADVAPANALPANASPVSASPLGGPSAIGVPGANMAPNPNAICGMLQPGTAAATANDCRVCHGRQAGHGHPTEFDYAQWARGSGTISLRPLGEVQRRGLALPDGQVRCVTCHDASSPWKFHVKLPQGARPMAAVDFRRPITYENPRALPPPQRGDDVAKKSLCVACHSLD